MATQDESRPPFPPFTEETARTKVKAAQDGWNTKSVLSISVNAED